MNGLRAETLTLAQGMADYCRSNPGRHCDVLVCPPFTTLALAVSVAAGSGLMVGAQDCHANAGGAHTGDIAAEMLADIGVNWVIVGHSERRTDHGEASPTVRAKALAAQRAGLRAIVCVGETLAEREAGKTLEILSAQLQGSVPSGVAGDTLVVAYEPVWAIGTGKTPTIAEVAAAHAHIRRELGRLGLESGAIRILYGGSVKATNAAELLAIADVDGALVGGASLKVTEFSAICAAC